MSDAVHNRHGRVSRCGEPVIGPTFLRRPCRKATLTSARAEVHLDGMRRSTRTPDPSPSIAVACPDGPRHATCEDARKCLRSLAEEAARLDPGRAANRLSAYALVIAERPRQRQEMCVEIEMMAEQTPNHLLAGVLREASRVVHEVLEA
jgi:hypothetical protein